MSDTIYTCNGVGYDYTMQGAYESCLRNQIDNENRLADMIEEALILTESTSTYTMKKQKLRGLYESKLVDGAKNKWQKFVQFIKSLFGKFMESMTNILLNEQEYLKKYKDIILKKNGKSDITISYTGDYEVGTQRIIDTTVPMFDYAKYKDALEKDGDEALLKALVPDVKEYDEDDGAAVAMKQYFIAAETGEKDEVGLDKMNFASMYNFCFDFRKIKAVVEKDVRFLEQSTDNINKAMQEAIKNDEEANKNTGNTSTENVEGKGVNGNNENSDQQVNSNQVTNTTKKNTTDNDVGLDTPNESFMYLSEAEEEKPTTTTNLKVDQSASNKIHQHVGSYTNKDDNASGTDSAIKKANVDAATKEGVNADKVNNAVQKWIRVCRSIITAKWTAAEIIAKDYMNIIRTHVRSYVGKKEDTADNRGAKQTTADYKYKGDRGAKVADNKTEEQETNATSTEGGGGETKKVEVVQSKKEKIKNGKTLKKNKGIIYNNVKS